MGEEQRKAPMLELDLISNLPSDIVEMILACLPIKEAVRTSILSTKWRHRPTMLQNIKFDEQCVSTHNHITFTNIVDQVLLLHIGPIHKFVLSHRNFLATADIDRWVIHLSRSSVKCLKLEIWKGDRYNLTSCFFSCEDLIHLRLHNCILEPPSNFKGFLSLEHLDIENVTLTQHDLQRLIARCPMLKELNLKDCDGFKNICINAPNLIVLYIDSEFEDVILQNTLDLAFVYMDLKFNVRWVVGRSSNLLRFLVHLPNIRYLKLEGYSLKYLAFGPSVVKLPQPILFLNDLFLDLNFTDLEEITVALCLIRSSPALQRLQIWVDHNEDYVVGEADSWFENLGDNLDCQLTELGLIEIADICGAKAELDFIKFLLMSSPVLKCMTLKPASLGDSLERSFELLKEVVRFRRASVQAEIIFLDPPRSTQT